MTKKKASTKKTEATPTEEGELANSPASIPVDSQSPIASAASSPSGSHGGSTTPQRLQPSTLKPQNMDIIQRLDAMNNDFVSKFEGVLQAIQEVKADVRGFTGRLDEAEQRISDLEDTVNREKNKTEELIYRYNLLQDKVDELENRSRRNNLRVINLPEKIEKNDPIGFVTKWLPEALGDSTFPSPLIIEAAHRIPLRHQATKSNRPPPTRAFIIKFLNRQDKERAVQAARTKGKIMCGDQEVMLFPDLSAQLLERRRTFDPVKKELKSLNMKYGLMFPARLRVWLDGGQTREFSTPEDAGKFVRGLQQKGQPQEK